MARVICPQCGSESYFSLVQPVYQGPYRCTKCKVMFSVRIENDEVKSAQLMSQQEISKLPLHNPYK
jgi:transposase-like protein